MVNCSRLLLKLVETPRVSDILLQHVAEFCAAWCGSLSKAAKFQTNKLTIIRIVTVHFAQTSRLLWHIVILKVWFTSDVFQVLEVNFCQTCQVWCFSTLLMTEKFQGIPFMCLVICLINQVNPAALK